MGFTEAGLIDVANTALEFYALSVTDVSLINNDYNATFKIETNDGDKYALRVNINSPRNVANLKAEVAWANFLANDARVKVPHPISSAKDEYFCTFQHGDQGVEFKSVLYSWLDGEELGDEPTAEQLRSLGAAMATLHVSSKDFELPADAALPDYKDPMWETEDFLLSSKSVLDPDAKSLIAQALEVIKSEIDSLYREHEQQIIHADLHGWNVMWHNGEIAVFDFDDCGFGLPVQDLATAIYYLDTPEQDAALKEGYESVAELPRYTESQMQMFMIQRRIILLNFLFESSNDEHRAMLPAYLEESLRRITKFLSERKE
jgi:Ser/Thr protein kinase RdoA (MazF antagonist)